MPRACSSHTPQPASGYVSPPPCGNYFLTGPRLPRAFGLLRKRRPPPPPQPPRLLLRPAPATATAPGKLPAVAIICVDGTSPDPSQIDAILTADFSASKAFGSSSAPAIAKVFEEKNLARLSTSVGVAEIGKAGRR